MPEVTDAELVAMVEVQNPPLAAVVQRAFEEKGSDEAGARAAVWEILAVFDADGRMTEEICAVDPGQQTAQEAALVRIREIGRRWLEGRWGAPPAKVPPVPDEIAAGEPMRDFDLLVTVRVYGAGSAMDAAGALCSGRGTFDLPGDGEVEILSARPVDADARPAI